MSDNLLRNYSQGVYRITYNMTWCSAIGNSLSKSDSFPQRSKTSLLYVATHRWSLNEVQIQKSKREEILLAQKENIPACSIYIVRESKPGLISKE